MENVVTPGIKPFPNCQSVCSTLSRAISTLICGKLKSPPLEPAGTHSKNIEMKIIRIKIPPIYSIYFFIQSDIIVENHLSFFQLGLDTVHHILKCHLSIESFHNIREHRVSLEAYLVV
jgi:hypothetical protein